MIRRIKPMFWLRSVIFVNILSLFDTKGIDLQFIQLFSNNEIIDKNGVNVVFNTIFKL